MMMPKLNHYLRDCSGPSTRPTFIKHRTPGYRMNYGFSLIEIGVALFIITLVLGSILIPLATQVEQKQNSDTQKTMDEIKEALLGFVTANGYLPCPDTTGDGVADPNTPGTCTTSPEGSVPWVTLNVTREDAWGNRFRYRVTPEFTNTPPTGACSTGDGRLGLCDNGIIRINTRNPTTKATQIIVINAAAIIVSHGKNGYGATSSDGTARASVPASNVDETANTDANAIFANRTATGLNSSCSDTVAGQPFCEFDDIVTWISVYSIFNRMVAAGKLP